MPLWSRRLLTWALKPIESCACIHDWDYQVLPASYWNFTKANFLLMVNAFRMREIKAGIVAGIICQIAGWPAFKVGKVAKVRGEIGS